MAEAASPCENPHMVAHVTFRSAGAQRLACALPAVITSLYFAALLRFGAFALATRAHFAATYLYLAMRRGPPRPRQRATVTPPAGTTYVFIVPVYLEDHDIVAVTLQQLASHPAASSYVVVLSVEASRLQKQPGARKGVVAWSTQFGGRFRHLEVTHHELASPEAAGKASNVACGLCGAQRALQQLGVAPASAMATVLDADNRLNAAYVDSAASLVFAAPEDRPVLTHGSCVIDGDSTGLVSAMDGLWLSTVSMHAWRFTPCNFPQSVYSLRCDVLLATGVDVGALGMAEDAITSIRAHFRKNADSIQLAGASFYASPCPDVATRLTQMKRHQYGVTIASHALVAWLARPSPRHLVCLMQV